MAKKETESKTAEKEEKTNDTPDTRALSKKDKATMIPKELKPFVEEGYDVIQVGGTTKWVDMEAFAEEGAGRNEPCKSNGRIIEGVLLGKQGIDAIDPRTKEIVHRYFFNFQLLSPCPVNYKDEDGSDIEEDAMPGDIVALGERSKLAFLHQLCDDGGMYQLRIVPHSRIPIGGGQTLWTFNIGKKVLRMPSPQLVARGEKAPF